MRWGLPRVGEWLLETLWRLSVYTMLLSDVMSMTRIRDDRTLEERSWQQTIRVKLPCSGFSYVEDCTGPTVPSCIESGSTTHDGTSLNFDACQLPLPRSAQAFWDVVEVLTLEGFSTRLDEPIRSRSRV